MYIILLQYEDTEGCICQIIYYEREFTRIKMSKGLLLMQKRYSNIWDEM